jgi:hypothetical protein
MSADTATLEAIHHALRHHHRTLAPTGHGVQCECGRHYRDHDAWGRHLAALAAAAIEEPKP